MRSETLLLFVMGSLALVAFPGPDFVYVMTRGMAQGVRAGLLSACGISLGLLVHTMLAALGLTVILQTSALAFNVVKWAGAIYLVYLGWKMLRERDVFTNDKLSASQNHRSLMLQGILTNVFNPKAALTFVAYLPQFVDSHAAFSATLQIAVLGALLALIALLWFSFVGAFAGRIGVWLSSRQKLQRNLQMTAGAVLIGLGLRLALVRR